MSLTRYYFPTTYVGSGDPPLGPSAAPWNVFTATYGNYNAQPNPPVTSMASGPVGGIAGDKSRCYSYTTPAVAATTVYSGGTFRAAFRCENWIGGGKKLAVLVRRLNAAGAIVGSDVGAIAESSVAAGTTVLIVSGTLNAVTLDPGDRFCIEVGATFATTASGQSLYIERGTTGSDLPFIAGSAATGRPWVELEWDSTPVGAVRRYYLGKNIVPTQSPSFSSWTVTANAVRRVMSRVAAEPSAAPGGPDPNEFASASFTKGAGGLQRVLGGQWVADDRLPAGPVKGTISFSVGAAGAMTFIDNLSVHRAVAKVVSADGTTVRGTLYTGPGLPSSEVVSADNYWWHVDTAQWVHSAALTEVVAQEGDRLVFEYGVESSFAYDWPNFIFRYGAPRDRPDMSDSVRAISGAERPWVEFNISSDRPLYVGPDKVKKLYLGATEVPHLSLGSSTVY